MRRYGPWRRAVQLAFAALFLALPFVRSSALAGTYVALKLGPVELLEPASALAAALAARDATASLVTGALPLVVLAVVLGPVFCAWGCPFGLVSELLDAALRRRRDRGRWTRATASAVAPPRFALATGLLVASLPLGFPLAALVAPPRLLTALPIEARAVAGIPLVTSVLLGLALLADLVGPRRLVCRVLCPAGAVAALLRRRGTVGPRFEPARCVCPPETAHCFVACPWAVDPRSMHPLDGCTTCLACVDRCPSGAITVGAGEPAPARPERRPGGP